MKIRFPFGLHMVDIIFIQILYSALEVLNRTDQITECLERLLLVVRLLDTLA